MSFKGCTRADRKSRSSSTGGVPLNCVKARRLAWALIGTLLLAACGGGGGKSNKPTINVQISPSSATVAVGGTQQFSATVTGSSNTGVTWSATGAGTVSASGLFTAGNAPGNATVTATSVANTSRATSVTIAVIASADTTAPSITSSVPAANASAVDPTQPITVTFSEPIVATGLVLNLSNGGQAVAFSQQIQGNVLTLVPMSASQLTGAMSLSIQGARDAAGNVMATASWSWTLRPATGDDLAINGFTGQDFPNLRESLTRANCDPSHPDNANFAANVIDVGPGQSITDLSQVAWESLPAHTMVRIHPKPAPYNERIFIVTSDIKVCGVKDANGVRPKIVGLNARVRSNSALQTLIGTPAQEYSTVNRGIVAIARDSGIRNIVVEGLNLTGTMSAPYSGNNHAAYYVGMDNQTHAYNTHTGCVYVSRAQDVTIRDNEFSFCPVGVYVISRGLDYGGDHYLTRNFLLEGNYFHDNGLVDDYNVHQAYIQGVNFVVQYNYFGNPIRYDIDNSGAIDNDEASNGNDLKMRTVGELVRYNYFENGAHSIDLIDVEDFRPSVFPWFFELLADRSPGAVTPAQRTRMQRDWMKFDHGSYMYGNIFRRDEKVHVQTMGASMVHFGSDNSPIDGRRGKLWFYFNTIVTGLDKHGSAGAATLFSCCLDNADSYDYYDGYLVLAANAVDFHMVANGKDYGVIRRRTPDEFWGRYVAVNNAVQVMSATNSLTNAQPFHWNTYKGEQIELRRNYVTSNWNQPLWNGYPTPGYGDNEVSIADFSYPGANTAHHVTGAANLLSGNQALNPNTTAPVSNGALCGQAVAWTDDIPLAVRPNYQIQLQDNGSGGWTPGVLVVSGRSAHTTLGASQCN